MSKNRLLIVEPSPLVQNVIMMILSPMALLVESVASFEEVEQPDGDDPLYDLYIIGSDALKNHDPDDILTIRDMRKLVIAKESDLEFVESLGFHESLLIKRPFRPGELVESIRYQLQGGGH